MDLGVRGKVALVTGASSGIGEAAALALAREGAKVAGAARRRERLPGEAARAKQARGGEGARVAVAARRRERLEDVAARARKAGAPDARAYVADQTDAVSLVR